MGLVENLTGNISQKNDQNLSFIKKANYLLKNSANSSKEETNTIKKNNI